MDEFQKYIEESLKNIKFEKVSQKILMPKYNLHDDVKNLIVRKRTEANLTQKQLAHIAGLSQANISRMETGQTIPNLITLKKIADALGKKLVIEFVDFEGDEIDDNNY